MANVIEKDLLSYLLKLEENQQKLVLAYVKQLLEKDQLNKDADQALEDIKNDRVISFEEFKQQTDQWIAQKTGTQS